MPQADTHMKRKSKVGRNDPCPCGSGRKYKKCCQGKSTAPKVDLRQEYEQKHRIRFKTPDQIEGIRKDWGFDKPLYTQYGVVAVFLAMIPLALLLRRPRIY